MVTSVEELYPYRVAQKMLAWETEMAGIGLKLTRKNLSPNKRGSLQFHLDDLYKKMADIISGYPS